MSKNNGGKPTGKKEIAVKEHQELSPEGLISQAISNQTPVDVMERLLKMRTQLKAEASKEAFFNALAGFQSECPVIIKDKPVGSGNFTYNYAPLDSIIRQVRDLLQKYGFSYTIETRFINEPPTQVAICKVHHIAGHSESSEFTAPVDMGAKMNLIQKHASSLTYAKRYAFCNAFGILTGDEDNDARSVETTKETEQETEKEVELITTKTLDMLKEKIKGLGLKAQIEVEEKIEAGLTEKGGKILIAWAEGCIAKKEKVAEPTLEEKIESAQRGLESHYFTDEEKKNWLTTLEAGVKEMDEKGLKGIMENIEKKINYRTTIESNIGKGKLYPELLCFLEARTLEQRDTLMKGVPPNFWLLNPIEQVDCLTEAETEIRGARE